MSEMRIFDVDGNRLYLNSEEIDSLKASAAEMSTDVRMFIETLIYTGCRISEALSVSPRDVQRKELQITIRSLKKRRNDIFRNIPVPKSYMDMLVVGMDIIERQKSSSRSRERLWNWSRQHGYDLVKELMEISGIPPGKHRSPKGIRHAYGVNAIMKDIPLNLLQKWMGHADISTTAIYTNAIGKEEALIASKMWEQ